MDRILCTLKIQVNPEATPYGLSLKTKSFGFNRLNAVDRLLTRSVAARTAVDFIVSDFHEQLKYLYQPDVG